MKKESCYLSANKIIGPCGPCSFINLVGLSGKPELEQELAEEGRLKPFYASDFTSFLLWADKYNIKIKVFVEDTNLPEGLFQMMFKYEKIPVEKQESMKKELNLRHKSIIKKFRKNIFELSGNPIDKIDNLLKEGYAVAFNIADYFGGDFLVGHQRVVYGKKDKFFLIKDSKYGLMKLTEEEMKVHIIQGNKAIEFPIALIAFKK
jgi:hypothetical protein